MPHFVLSIVLFIFRSSRTGASSLRQYCRRRILDLLKSEHSGYERKTKGAAMVHEDLSFRIIGCCMAVHNGLGPGLLEQCYHNALFFELKSAGLTVRYNAPFTVKYRGEVVGEYLADLLVEGRVVIELKSVKRLAAEHTAQLINYLHISGCRLGLLVNFQGTSLEWKRLVV